MKEDPDFEESVRLSFHTATADALSPILMKNGGPSRRKLQKLGMRKRESGSRMNMTEVLNWQVHDFRVDQSFICWAITILLF